MAKIQCSRHDVLYEPGGECERCQLEAAQKQSNSKPALAIVPDPVIVQDPVLEPEG